MAVGSAWLVLVAATLAMSLPAQAGPSPPTITKAKMNDATIEEVPSFGNASVGTKSWLQWSAITSFTVPAATGGDGTLVYTATGLAAGVTMSGARAVSGMPSAADTGTATVTATDSDGDTATLTFDWTVSEDRVPSFDNASVGSKSWYRGSPITSFAVPAASGGDGTLVYTAMGLAAGVSMSGARVVSGTPSAAGTGTATVTARDSDGDAAVLTFGWTVTAEGARTLRRVSEAILPSAAPTILDDTAVERRVAAMDEGSRDAASVSLTLGEQEVKPVAGKPVAGGRRYRVQLAAFSTASRAAAAKAQAARRLEGFLKRNEQTLAVTGPEADGLWRIVLAGAFGRRAVADKVCAMLKANGNGCYVARVPPR